MLKITAIKGSPRGNSHSSKLLEETLAECRSRAEEQGVKLDEEILKPFTMNIEACTGCFSCSETATCIFNDDMDYLIDEGRFDQSDIILISTPIYFNGMPSHLKKLIDRCQPIYASKYDLEESIIRREKERRSLLIACAGAPAYEDQFTAAQTVSDLFFKTVNADKYEGMLVDNTDEIPPEKSEELKQRARKLGRELIDQFN